MKNILILFILISCGKEIKKQEPLFSQLSHNLDQDGDGVTDALEIIQGRNHLVADINTNQSDHKNTYVLIDEMLSEHEFELKPRRLLRREIIQKVVGVNKKSLSDINELILDFNTNQSFWKLFHSGKTFNRFYIFNQSQHHLLPADFNNKRQLRINNFTDYDLLENVKQSTYRLIISTPQKETIYYLHPSISIKSFLMTQHQASFAGGQLTSLDGFHAPAFSANSLDKEDEGFLWAFFTDAADSVDHPEVGKDYVYAFASVKELKQSTLYSGKMGWDHILTNIFEQRTERTIFIPSFYQAVIETQTHRTLWESGMHSISCNYTIAKSTGVAAISPTTEQVVRWLNPLVMKELSIIWSHQSARGTTVRLSSLLTKVEQSTFLSSEVASSMATVGITQDTCPGGSASTSQVPLYSGYSEFYLAE